jgi:predicted kinase
MSKATPTAIDKVYDAASPLPNRLADDLLEGADKIAEEIFGDPKQRRRIYWLVEKQRLPVFRIGITLCARRSTLREWIAAQERAGLGA